MLKILAAVRIEYGYLRKDATDIQIKEFDQKNQELTDKVVESLENWAREAGKKFNTQLQVTV